MGRKRTPIHILIPGTHTYDTFHGKRDFADLSKLKVLRWETVMDYLGRPHVITMVRIRRGSRGEGGVMRKGGREWSQDLCRWNEEATAKGFMLNTEKGKATEPSSEPPQGNSPTDTLTLAQENEFWTSYVQNCKRINVCGFKLPHLYYFVTVTTGNQ